MSQFKKRKSVERFIYDDESFEDLPYDYTDYPPEEAVEDALRNAMDFYFGYRGKMEGNSKIINLISRDENLHVAITQNILKYLRDNPDEGFQSTFKKSEEKIYEFYRAAVDAEKNWADYLFSKGSLVGLTPESLKQYVEWLANNRLTSLGLKKLYETKTNPLAGWLDSFYDSKKVQVAPQETEISSYVKGVDSKLDDKAFDDFKL